MGWLLPLIVALLGLALLALELWAARVNPIDRRVGLKEAPPAISMIVKGTKAAISDGRPYRDKWQASIMQRLYDSSGSSLDLRTPAGYCTFPTPFPLISPACEMVAVNPCIRVLP